MYVTRLVNNVKQKLIVPKNFCLDTGFFTDEDVNLINHMCSGSNLNEGELFDGLDYSERKAKLHFIETITDDNRWLYEKMNTLIGYYNDTEFGYDLVGYDYFQYAEYHTGGHQKFHTDMRYEYDQSYITECFRKLTVILMLSDASEYEGGELLLNVASEARSFPFKLNKGQVLIFPSYMPHQVNPVISGVRKTLVTWALGPKFR